jgi:fluoroquinolone resistance protein
MLSPNDHQHIYIDKHFIDVDLTNTTLLSKQFEDCYFTDCNFSNTKFTNCKFYQCKFHNCNLSLLDVSSCTFFDTTFEACKAIGINWTKAAWPNIKLSSPIHFTRCTLNDSSFFGLSLKEIIITECTAHEVDFREAYCSAADFSHTDFAGSLFNNTNLTKANFIEALNYRINPTFNKIKKAKFSLPEAISLLKSLDIELVD